VTSYLDKLTMSFTADRAAVPDPEFLQACLDRSFRAHLSAANAAIRKQPQLLQAVSAVKRRAHPGMAAMGRAVTTGESTPTPLRRRAAAGAPSALVPKRAGVTRAAVAKTARRAAGVRK
jgi:hypothetical protein